MRELMLGNRAVARGLYESGCEVLSAYPGTPSTEIEECAAAYDDIYCEWRPMKKSRWKSRSARRLRAGAASAA